MLLQLQLSAPEYTHFAYIPGYPAPLSHLLNQAYRFFSILLIIGFLPGDLMENGLIRQSIHSLSTVHVHAVSPFLRATFFLPIDKETVSLQARAEVGRWMQKGAGSETKQFVMVPGIAFAGKSVSPLWAG